MLSNFMILEELYFVADEGIGLGGKNLINLYG